MLFYLSPTAFHLPPSTFHRSDAPKSRGHPQDLSPFTETDSPPEFRHNFAHD